MGANWSSDGGAASPSQIDWGDLYAHIATCTGWQLDYIRNELTLPQLAALNRYWQKNPPPPMQLARIGAVLGLKPPEQPTPANQDGSDLIKSMMAAGIPVTEGLPDDPMLKFLDD